MTIAGEDVDARERMAVLNPATEQVAGECGVCGPELLDRAMEAARGAADAWAADLERRRRALAEIAAAVRREAGELAAVLTAEQGKPLKAALFEVGEVARWFEAFAAMEPAQEELATEDGGHAVVRRVPLGVVAAITPWNFPLLLVGWKAAPALLAGNTMVLKPSPFTPLSTLLLGRVIAAAVPPGVFSAVAGGDDLGARMTGHPVPRKISFTGSVRTGAAVMRAAAEGLKRVTLELGGNDAAIVLDDADPDAVESPLFWGAFANSGQICAGIKRLYVPESLADPILERLVDRAKRTPMGDGTDPAVKLGPIQNRPQFDRVSALTADAVARGGTVAAGGHRLDRPGYFHAPTIVTGVGPGVPLVDEEQFGPVLPVMVYRDVEDAIAAANATEYGLSGSVWSADVDRAARVAGRLDAGTVRVNDHLTFSPRVPFGGRGVSGLGVENGPWGLDEFSDLQVLRTPGPRP
ncbi:aldehyde dehydrogenase family protein [Actinomadura sp. LD22]|uniref:Aldehyde dehydrogenase family protein n=2 Tax=Actinomadura physcomitrii TaxID=2650748 RepID=A0A6I4MB84_9ACTN|nr:aldehyde dehydrogenase family protein [Actinomadura physcomitrii]